MEVQVLVSSPPFELSDSSASEEEKQPTSATTSPSNPLLQLTHGHFLKFFFNVWKKRDQII